MLFGYWYFQAQAEPAPKKTESWGLQSGQTGVLQFPCRRDSCNLMTEPQDCTAWSVLW